MRPTLHFAVHENGEIELLSPWYPHIEIAQDALDAATDPKRLTVERVDGVEVMTFRCTNGWGKYILGPLDERRKRPGTLWRSG